MREIVIIRAISAASLSQEPGVAIPKGVPLRVMLDQRVAVKSACEPFVPRLFGDKG
jgi:hypothetical protein